MFRLPRISLLAVAVFARRTLARHRLSFQHFFPDVEVELHNIVANNCSNTFHLYKTEHITLYGQYCVKMFSCVMNAATEYTKANFASASVLLGLTPTVLATAGSTTPELVLLASRRPALAIAIVLGSPAVNALRAFDFSKSIMDFKRVDISPKLYESQTESRENTWASKSTSRRNLIVAVEWSFVLLALGNLAQLSFIINQNTIAIMSCDNSDMLVELWIGLSMVTHMFGTVTFFSRSSALYRNVRTLRYWLNSELSPCAFHEVVELEWRNENKRFIVASWLTSVFTLYHLAFGTLMFSSLFFVGTWPSFQSLIWQRSPSRNSMGRLYHRKISCFCSDMSNYRSL
jgi:hypothetical protein